MIETKIKEIREFCESNSDPEIIKKYSKYFKEFDVAIIIESFGNRVIYVGGQVEEPGSYPMAGNMTVFEALVTAGGVRIRDANYKKVLVIRNINGRWKRTEINMKQIINGEQLDAFYLKPMDIVFVPATGVTR